MRGRTGVGVSWVAGREQRIWRGGVARGAAVRGGYMGGCGRVGG